MFTRAGFNARHARLGIWGLTRWVWAELIRFRPSGDLAWHGKRPNGHGFLTWGHTCSFGNLISDGLNFLDRYQLPKSDIR